MPADGAANVVPPLPGGAAGTRTLAAAAAVWSNNGRAAPTPFMRTTKRPSADDADGWVRLGELEIGPSRLQVSFGGKSVALTRIEYALLRRLAERPGQVCRYSELAFASHRLEVDDGEARDLLRTHLQNLRSKLCRSYFRIEAGAGCMLAVPAPAPSRLAV
jgi:DNA-binding response OmpR family regulator